MGFSIRQLLGVTLIIAVGLVALANADKYIVVAIARQFVLIVLIIAAYSIWISQGETRAFRIGFLVWASIYYLLHVVIDKASLNFVTATLLSDLRPTIFPSAYVRDASGQVMRVRWFENYDTIGHSILAILFGMLGGLVTVFFYRKRQQMLADGRLSS